MSDNIVNLHSKQPGLQVAVPKSSETQRQIIEMMNHFGYKNDPEGFSEAVISALHSLTLAECSGGSIVITPPDGAPVPFSLNEFMRPELREIK